MVNLFKKVILNELSLNALLDPGSRVKKQNERDNSWEVHWWVLQFSREKQKFYTKINVFEK